MNGIFAHKLCKVQFDVVLFEAELTETGPDLFFARFKYFVRPTEFRSHLNGLSYTDGPGGNNVIILITERIKQK